MAPYQASCNCGSITLSMPEKPEGTLLCFCANCRKAGGAFSMNYTVDEANVTVEDTNKTLRVYEDSKTTSGTTIQRVFCGQCGSPIYTKTPNVPGKLYVKASLFEDVAPVTGEAYPQNRGPWLHVTVDSGKA